MHDARDYFYKLSFVKDHNPQMNKMGYSRFFDSRWKIFTFVQDNIELSSYFLYEVTAIDSKREDMDGNLVELYKLKLEEFIY